VYIYFLQISLRNEDGHICILSICMYIYIFVYIYVCILPDPINHVCSLTGRYISEKYFTYRSVQIFKILFRRFYSPESDPPHKIMRYRFYDSIHRWVFHFNQTTLVWWNFFVPQLYQFRRGILGGPALKYFNMIHRGGRVCTCIRLRFVRISAKKIEQVCLHPLQGGEDP